MTSLLPTLQAADLRRALTDYLSTTFALTDDDVRTTLEAFLGHEETGIFRGPLVRLRLPFRPATGAWSVPLDWYPDDFTPYGHQARAFERLSSKHDAPQPTLVTTGTGSGKTEAFLFPLLDHALRAKNQGQRGIKALILYPMNALANDQAGRIAEHITGDPRLGGLTAALYTGEQGVKRTQVKPDGLITDRQVMRGDPPDILLTNYKMLDQLLLRADDVPLWDGARESLTYLVLDEFHTYDGAQGTDVAMLLRRLGAALDVAQPDRPLGDVTPIATSATLGPGAESPEATTAMREFAETVFGRTFDSDSVVTEDRVPSEEWLGEVAAGNTRGRRRRPPRYQPRDLLDVTTAAALLRTAGSSLDAIDGLIGLIVQRADGDDGSELDEREIRRLRASAEMRQVVATHPLTAILLEHAQRPVSLAELAADVFPADRSMGRADGITVLDTYLGLLSLLRAQAEGEAGRVFLSVDVHLWIREVSRVDRQVSATPSFRWSDDGAIAHEEHLHLPAIYCRHCGRSGWAALRMPTGMSLDVNHARIRQASLNQDRRIRSLIYAGGEAAVAESTPGERPTDRLMWLDVRSRELATEPADDGDDETRHVPVLVDWHDTDESARHETCPSCRQADGIRFLGASRSTLASVSLSTLFGATGLDTQEKKALLFTDSVQDAAHTAGFVQARSHTMTWRATILGVLGHTPTPLPDVVTAMLEQAGHDPVARYRLVPPSLADRDRFAAFWQQSGSRSAQRAAQRAVEERLAFDVALEHGLQSRTGRTLELTGSAVAEIDVGSPERLQRMLTALLADTSRDQSLSPELDEALGMGIDPHRLRGWARGVLERLRTRGGIDHRWLEAYLKSDGNRWFLWGGRPRGLRDAGMPAFPFRRPAPAFPTTNRIRENLDPIGGTGSWYARWAVRQLGVTPRDGSLLTRALLDRAVHEGWLTASATDSGATVYRLPPELIVVHAPRSDDLEAGKHAVRCDVCQTVTPGSQATIDDLAGARCLRPDCPGSLHRHAQGEDYYRGLYANHDMRRVVSREHTSLLPDEVRLRHEEQFRSGTSPDSPNVLAATPTLELGIDIGDLSTVMLASLPGDVASYLQRVGRAGRLTGNALVLGYVYGRGQNLQRLDDPRSLIDGEVRPPATYLDAIEILQRQYLAHIVDRRARTGAPDPRSPREVLGRGWEPGTWIGDLLADARKNATSYVDAFLELFGSHVQSDTAAHLRSWSGVGIDPGQTSGLEHLVHSAVSAYQHELEDLAQRSRALQDALPELREAAERATATDDDARELRTAQSEQRALDARRNGLLREHWVAALEARGVLPNYTLLDDGVTLDVSVRWIDHDTGEFHTEPASYQRGRSVALTEFAPGATFYAQGTAVPIDALDIGSGIDTVAQSWRLCARCGWTHKEGATAGSVPGRCSRCGDAAIGDTGQRLDVVPLERVNAEVRRDEALISDTRDDRLRERFTTVCLVDIDPHQIRGAWQLSGYPFGAEFVTDVEIGWLNLGRERQSGRERSIAGDQVRAPLFQVCPGCGIVPAAQHRDEGHARHRGWCVHRRDLDVPWRWVALSRSLRTQAVQLLVPPHFSVDTFAGPSFQAALLLGLREVLGGSPDHLEVVEVRAPVDGGDRSVLVLHDTVPGGTGYLADFARPSRVRELLAAAYDVVANCRCQDADGILACHRCLLPFAPSPAAVDRTSRARAQQLLGEILSRGEVDGYPADESLWVTENVTSLRSVPPPSPESHLEQRFRTLLVEALKARGADVTEEPHVDGAVVHINMPGVRRRQWTLRPQPTLLGTQPDFVLLTEDPSVPRMYIYTDGYHFHATSATNRLADDAEKRAGLRREGHVVWAVTAGDLDAFEGVASGRSVTPPQWFTHQVQQRLTQLRGKLIPAGSVGDDALRANALTQIIDWIASPDRQGWQRLASGLPLAFWGEDGRSTFERDELPAAARALLDGEAVPESTTDGLPAWWWHADGLVLVAASPSTPRFDVGAWVVIDDRDEALDAHDARATWRMWLSLSNVLGLAERPPFIETMSRLESAAAEVGIDTQVVPSSVLATEPEASLTEEWQALMTEALEDERSALEVVARAGVPLPELGYETERGVPVDIAWPDQHVAVLVADSSDDGLTEDGWTVLRVGVDDVAERLPSLLAREEAGG